jgi:hypothetical protein
MFDILLEGCWRPGQVRCFPAPGTFAPDEPTRRLIDAAWHQAAARPGVYLFDGPMCRLERYEPAGECLNLHLSETTYRAFVGTNFAHPELPVRADPVGLSVALESADGYLLMGRRNERVSYYPLKVHPFAGCMEPSNFGNAGILPAMKAGWKPALQAESEGLGAPYRPDVFAEALRELREELALEPADVPAMTLLGMVADRAIRQPELVFHARTRLTMNEVEARLDLREHNGLKAIAPGDLAMELGHAEDWTPVGVATATLWGRRNEIKP